MEEHCDDHSAHERAIGAHDKRLDSHSAQLDTLTQNLVELKEIAHQSQLTIERMDRRISALEAKPGRRWDSLVDKSVWAVAAAAIGYLLGGTI